MARTGLPHSRTFLSPSKIASLQSRIRTADSRIQYSMRHRRAILGFIVVVQFILLLAHYFLYQSWTFQHAPVHPGWLQVGLGILSVSFVAASLLAFSHTSAPVRAFYRGAAVWMGFLSFLFLAAVSAWIVLGIASLVGLQLNFHGMVELLFAIAAALCLYGLWNA